LSLAPALLIRCLCIFITQTLEDPSSSLSRREFITPTTDLKRVLEALFLRQHGLDEYSGDALHQPPLILLFFQPFQNVKLHSTHFQLLFLALDLLTALILYSIAVAILKSTNKDEKVVERSWLPELVYNLYLLNPFTLFTSLANSTIIFNNLAIVLSLHQAIKGNGYYCILFVAMGAYLTVYPIMLILPISLILRWSLFKSTSTLLILLLSLLGISYGCVGGWGFIMNSYVNVFMVQDLTPNIGLFWYFFMEVFPHFRNFFIFAYQYHPFIYAIPLYIRLRDKPLLLFWILLSIIVTFKCYPSYGDVGLQLSIIALLYDDFSTTKYGFISGTVSVFVFTMSPILWWMWIYSGAGNANFYYAINLVFSFTQVLLITDIGSIAISKQIESVDNHVVRDETEQVEK